MSSMADTYGPKLDLGRVASDAVSLLARQPVLFFGLSLVFAGIPSAVSAYLKSSWWLDDDSFFLRHHGPGLLISMLIAGFLEGCLFRLGFAELAGRKAGLREVLESGLKFFLPLFAVRFLFWCAVAFGMIFLVVPGVMIAMAWIVAAPVLVAERGSITDTFGRSAFLTRDNRWRIFGLVLLFGVACMLLGAVLGAFTGWHEVWFDDVFEPSPFAIGRNLVFVTLTDALFLAGLSSLYVRLRELKEGFDPAGLADG
jgi:hypothetical protein